MLKKTSLISKWFKNVIYIYYDFQNNPLLIELLKKFLIVINHMTILFLNSFEKRDFF